VRESIVKVGVRVLLVAAIALPACAAGGAAAQGAVLKMGYLTMSDGVKLHYAVELPAETGRFPVAMKYDGYCEGTAPMTCNEGEDASALLADGYAVLGVAIRGTGCSEGEFEFRNPQENSDGAAAVTWAASQPWSTGHVGMFGDSFPGLMQPGVAALRPKGLDAIAPWQIVDDLYRDAAYPGGIANGEFGVFWAAIDQPQASTSSGAEGTEAGEPGCAENAVEHTATNPPDNIFVKGLENPYMDRFWDERTVGAAAERIKVPAFGCQSWQDDEVGSRAAWTLWPRLKPGRSWFVGTNGYHSMCVFSKSITGELVDFFDRYVKGERNGWEKTPHVQLWHDTTSATDAEPAWITTARRWPLKTQTDRLFLGSGSALTAAAPSGGEPGDSYVSPTLSAGTEDGDVFGQRNTLWKVPGTPGGAVAYTTPKLAEATELLGPLSVDLWLSSTATDTNLQATITEVRPDGEEVYVARGWLKASMRALDGAASTPTMPVQTDLESDVQPLVPGEPTFMRLAVNPIDYVFRAGSRIRLVIDTPSQTGGWNFEPLANGGVDTILHDAAHPSDLVFGTVRRVSAPAAYPACDTVLNQPCRPDAFPGSDPSGELG
jgi:uncharacterized protein